jgi:addiction module RelE/StbE family toxin
MKVSFHKNFEKQYIKLSQKLREQFKKRRDIFIGDPHSPILHNHPLQAEFAGYRSINITGDYRAIYKELGSDSVVFVKIGTHHELFGS